MLRIDIFNDYSIDFQQKRKLILRIQDFTENNRWIRIETEHIITECWYHTEGTIHLLPDCTTEHSNGLCIDLPTKLVLYIHRRLSTRKMEKCWNYRIRDERDHILESPVQHRMFWGLSWNRTQRSVYRIDFCAMTVLHNLCNKSVSSQLTCEMDVFEITSWKAWGWSTCDSGWWWHCETP